MSEKKNNNICHNYSSNKRSRTILFYEDIDEASALHVNKSLLSIDEELTKKYCKILHDEGPDINIKKPVINLRIHSPGGDVFSSLAIIDVITQLKCDVHTYIDGCAASGAAMIS